MIIGSSKGVICLINKTNFFNILASIFLLIGYSNFLKAEFQNFMPTDERVEELEESLTFLGQTIHQASLAGSRYPQIEDRMIAETLDSSIKYYGVYDGHGGSIVSEYLAKNFHKYLDQNRNMWINNPEKLTDFFQKFNNNILLGLKNEILSKAQDSDHARKMGTGGSTASLMINIPWQDKLIFATLGDSPVMVVSKDGQVYKSIDHEPLREEEKRAVESKGGRVQKLKHTPIIGNKVYPALEVGKVVYPALAGQGRLAVTRAFGDLLASPYISAKPDIYIFPKNQVAFVMLASDGLGEAFYFSGWNNTLGSLNWLAHDINLLMADDRGDDIAKRYLDSLKAHAKLGTDDISLMIIQ